MTAASTTQFPWKYAVLWVGRGLMAALFLFAASMKLTSQPMMVAEFGTLGIGLWFLYFTGALELIGAIALLVPAVSGLGAVLLLCVDIGAFFAQILAIHQDFVHTIIIGAILAALAYVQRSQILSRIGM